ncbi:xanthine dehydrogenase accessory protein XdhC [Sulfitobacter alexandrii]|uniref:Xanthine dehydrogenase accessory protein XdhC n=1 Tax=Sulfitobacter alexandrii TaxID=1917485 RepID=A0A1J0WJ77_9RHOB|nr:xanthine dehydrogenase accessory protein XdhC [Sulfitobacter alexandrii]APE44391.1 xanthine dehydrogenase accessory protein XdhC [Sulfitobacter alexandrii]
MSGALWVEILSVRGSAPREAGTAMKVTADTTEGTIGGGALELRAIRTARRMLATGAADRDETLPLGPGLGQCCGGSVTLRFGRAPRPVDKPDTAPPAPMNLGRRQPLWLWGAGHVGRAVVRACPPGAFDITWIDSGQDRFPAEVPVGVSVLPAADMVRVVTAAPREAHHLIFTYSHDIDLALCAALLKHGFASCGLIGSETKWRRFRTRLEALALDPAAITCPIGDKSLGRTPDAIAKGCVNGLVSRTFQGETA